MLGSSTYGAALAAQLGLPFAFASHFAPDYLHVACNLYRANFQPSEHLDRPYVIVGANVFAADTDAEARGTDAEARVRAAEKATHAAEAGTEVLRAELVEERERSRAVDLRARVAALALHAVDHLVGALPLPRVQHRGEQ